jgi:hypothetical protein
LFHSLRAKPQQASQRELQVAFSWYFLQRDRLRFCYVLLHEQFLAEAVTPESTQLQPFPVTIRIGAE